LAYTQKYDTRYTTGIKGWYSATTYITLRKYTQKKKTQNRKIDYCNLPNRMFKIPR